MTGKGDLVGGRYRLTARIGRGAMGVVWQAYDERLARTVAVSAGTTAAELLLAANTSGLKYPLFARSDAESAAKYVGFDGCVVPEADLAGFERVVENLRMNVRRFDEIAVKEIWPIRRAGTTALEYRALGYNGSLVGFDGSRNEPPSQAMVDLAGTVFSALASVGADGTHLVDFAERDGDGVPFVVEWKDLSGGSLNSATELFRALGQMSLAAM
ncbi:hypothetical protein ACFQ1S_26535 [Kibdelosporangium lantanae]|uniref:ATP-grasp domain-containing protein n=1 Tax=Kibdelosporangium lantanae TaxID=1497396 RepID=A0ABW3MFE4_9PSEU